MQVTVSLNTQKEIVWGLPASKVVLTVQAPTAIYNTDLMTEDQKQSLATAIRLGRVTSTVSPDLFFQVKKAPQAVSPASVVEKKEIIFPSSPTDVALEAKEALEGNVGEIKKRVLVSKDTRLLRMMLALEEGGRKRATLTKLLAEQILQLEQKVVAVSNAIVPGPRPLLFDPAITKLPGQAPIDLEVTDEVVEEITIVLDKNKEG